VSLIINNKQIWYTFVKLYQLNDSLMENIFLQTKISKLLVNPSSRKAFGDQVIVTVLTILENFYASE
jgi:ubiquinone biosynthesis protein Coq4